MKPAAFACSQRFLLVLFTALGLACGHVQPMPPIPDVRHLHLAPADSEAFVRAVMADHGNPIWCFDPLRGDTAGMTPPARIRGSTDAYPSQARRSGRQGWAAFTFIIDTTGTVEPNSVFLLGASDSVFVDEGRFVILNSVFAPARRHGTPIRAVASLVTEFRLKKVGLRL